MPAFIIDRPSFATHRCRNGNRYRRGAFALIELFFLLMVLTVMVAVSTPLIRWAATTAGSSQTRATSVLRLDNAIDLLRADVWQATRVDVRSGHEVAITGPGEKPILWTVTPGHLQRGSQAWDGLGNLVDGVIFKSEPSGLRVDFPANRDAAAGRSIVLSNQLSQLKPEPK